MGALSARATMANPQSRLLLLSRHSVSLAIIEKKGVNQMAPRRSGGRSVEAAWLLLLQLVAGRVGGALRQRLQPMLGMPEELQP